MLDWIVRGGTVIDGTGSAGYLADVGVQGDRIAAVGQLQDQKARRVLDARGLVVAPGFVDLHTHSDGYLLQMENFAAKTTQGFTTEVLMLDGISYAPVDGTTACQWLFYLRALDGLRMDQYDGWLTLADYMQRLDRRTAQNSLALVPYANVRAMACGFGRGRVDDFQRLVITEEIQRGMDAGAAGLSTGLDYIVQCHADTDELIHASRAMADRQGLYITHVRYKRGLLPALQEAFEIGRRAGVGVHISHLKAVGAEMVERVWALIEEAQQDISVSFDVYPYQSGSTMLNYLLPYDVWDDGPLAALDKLRCPDLRRRFAAGLNQYRSRLDQLRIAWLPGADNKHHQGKSLAQYVAESGRSAADALCDLLIEERLAVLLVLHEAEDAQVYPILQHDAYMMGSDGIYFPAGQVHPRVFGSATRLLGPLVREQRLFSLEQAVAKLTSRPARRFGLVQRGEIRESWYADLVIFDPQTVGICCGCS
jgi:N-acyl-D-amino-acid deacylase